VRRADPDLRSLRLPLAKEPPRSLRDLCDLAGLIMHKVLRDGSGKNLRDEVRRHAGDAAAQNCVGVRQELTNGVFVLEGVNRRTGVLRATCTTSPRIDLPADRSSCQNLSHSRRRLLWKLVRRKIRCGDDVAHVRLLLMSQRMVSRSGTC